MAEWTLEWGRFSEVSTSITAQSLQTPVITTNVGGQIDIVRNNRDGFLIPTGDAGALQRRLQSLVENRSHLAAMKQSAAQRAAEFSTERTATAFEALFDDLTPGTTKTMDVLSELTAAK